jgi:hypothetical protein
VRLLDAATSWFFRRYILGRIPHAEKETWEGHVTLTKERIEKHRESKYAKVIEHIEGCYEAQEVSLGMVYKWSPECLVAERGCGERTALTLSITTCAECETDHAAIVQEWLAFERLEAADEALRPWRCATDREDVGLPY